jgi:hypothetical protein
MMRKVGLLILVGLSAVSAIASAGWIFLVGGYLLSTGGTYGYMTADGSMVCRVPLFTAEDWLQVSLLMFGLPLIVLLVAVKLYEQGKHRLIFGSLP